MYATDGLDVTNTYVPYLDQPLMPSTYYNPWGTNVDARVNSQSISTSPGGIHTPGYEWRLESQADRFHASQFEEKGAPLGIGVWKGFLKNPLALNTYRVLNPEFSLCSVQLSDAIQRNLNEWSATNGLEIVYTDYDLTTSPIESSVNGTSVYTEVRKSASRALGAYARMTPTYTDTAVEQQADSNRSVVMYKEDIRDGGRGWQEYQWQLGSLYFPQQKVAGETAFDFDPIAYAHTLEACERWHGGNSNCFLSLGNDTSARSVDYNSQNQDYFRNLNGDHPDLASQDREYVVGQKGTFSGGGRVLAVSLERSSLFNLSGIPINNSRVLALRGKFSSVPTPYSKANRMNIYLKYVKLARIFLNNTEVEQ